MPACVRWNPGGLLVCVITVVKRLISQKESASTEMTCHIKPSPLAVKSSLEVRTFPDCFLPEKHKNYLSSVWNKSQLSYREHGRIHNLLTQIQSLWLTGFKFAQFSPGGEWSRDKPGLNPDHVYVLQQRNVLKAPSTPAKHFPLALMFLRTSHESLDPLEPRRHVITKINKPLTAFTEDHHDQLRASFKKVETHTYTHTHSCRVLLKKHTEFFCWESGNKAFWRTELPVPLKVCLCCIQSKWGHLVVTIWCCNCMWSHYCHLSHCRVS